jgi:hypothetical protein
MILRSKLTPAARKSISALWYSGDAHPLVEPFALRHVGCIVCNRTFAIPTDCKGRFQFEACLRGHRGFDVLSLMGKRSREKEMIERIVPIGVRRSSKPADSLVVLAESQLCNAGNIEPIISVRRVG